MNTPALRYGDADGEICPTCRQLVGADEARQRVVDTARRLRYPGEDGHGWPMYAHPDRDGRNICIPLRDPLGSPVNLWPNLVAALDALGESR